MVRKRKKYQEEELVWCFYCEKTFKDENDLLLHQKNKHFKCSECGKRLGNIKALTVHSLQVHKINVTSVPDALPDREDPAWEIFGMSGVPPGMKPGDPTPKIGEVLKISAPAAIPQVPVLHAPQQSMMRPQAPIGGPYAGTGVPPRPGPPQYRAAGPPPYVPGPVPRAPYPPPPVGGSYPSYGQPYGARPSVPPPPFMPAAGRPPSSGYLSSTQQPMPQQYLPTKGPEARPYPPGVATPSPYPSSTVANPYDLQRPPSAPAGNGVVEAPPVHLDRVTQHQAPLPRSQVTRNADGIESRDTISSTGGLVWANEKESMEELRASARKYHVKD